jgi:prolyl-tRNA editing enzyme YbaK/EbsC (Cys-tRNA(Pro) deacylase)
MRLQQFIAENGLTAEIIDLKTPTETVEESCKALNCEPENIVKSMVVTDRKGQYYLVLLQGDRKIKTTKLKRLLSVKDVKLASPVEVKEQTGYVIGDVPPISVELPAIVDELVLNQKMVYAGGGAPQKLIHVSVEEMIDCVHPLIADISVAI